MIRRAAPVDVNALRAIATAAYQSYVPRIGRVAAPTTADYEQAVYGGQIVGFSILIAQAEHPTRGK